MARKKASKARESKPEDDISINLSGIKNFFKNINLDPRLIILLVLILLPMIMSVHFRVQSAYLPVTENWAQNSVYNGIRSNIASQVDQQYPNLPSQNKQELVEQQLARVLEDQKATVDQQVKGTSDYFKSRLQDENGQTYLIAIDPYQFFRWVRNKVETGNYHNEIRNGEPWDTKMYAPVGTPFSPQFHVIMGYWVYLLVSFFNSGIPVLTTFFYLPVLISALSVVPAFFIARKKAGDLGGFVAAMIIAVHSTFLGRTAAGFSDTDAYTVFFPLMITWLFLEAFETDNTKVRVILGALTGLFVGIFSYAWVGWWYIFDFLVVVLGAYFGYTVLRQIIQHKDFKKVLKSEQIKSTLTVGVVFVVFSGIFVTLFKGWALFSSAPLQPLGFRIIKNAAHASLWPNVFTTVAELGNTGLGTIIGNVGGKMMFFLALLGLGMTMVGKKLERNDIIILLISVVVFVLLTTNKFMAMSPVTYLMILAVPLVIGLLLTLTRKEEIDVKYALFLTVWFAGTIYASTKGIRFILLVVPAFAIAFGISIDMIQRVVSQWITRELNIKDKWVGPVIMILLLFLLVAPIKSAQSVAPNEVPSMNDAWWEALTEIKQNSQEDAIINSWWDFGHWFKAVADRGVTFDGASQNSPMAHWIGKTLLTDDDEVAIGILRMLDCGSYYSFLELEETINDPTVSIRIMNEIILLERAEAKGVLTNSGLSETQAESILDQTHCEPPENFFITSQDMIGKAGVWAHFGSWDFERAYIYTNLLQKAPDVAIQEMQDKFGYDADKAQTLYYEATALRTEEEANAWISPWPNYVTGSWLGCSNSTVNDSNIFTCNIGASIGQQNNQHIVLETVQVNMDNVAGTTTTKFGIYDGSSGSRVGETLGRPNGIVIADEYDITTYDLDESSFSYNVLIDTVNKRALVLHHMFSESIFTKLYYLDGRYTEYFDKFTEKQGVNGQKIIVWKVDWDGKES